ncbi:MULTISPECIES: SDR family oxidoreductase [Streptacidiphilus]|uniref:SDR family NAD(P)-dependent oxidoreductase n=1 Tax=Streptacidiphilus cavernicola TaxID=3342716 RepID=A0ABV6USW1_9ACTN|nr:SDR family NAD(P)-dependent oxidoreductase [Streptacidiphilus jeojiense]
MSEEHMTDRDHAPDTAFAERYGPWALVAGASEGVGAAYARAMAERGVHVVLLARRQAVLDETAAAIRADTGVQTRTVAVDLSRDGAMETIVAATAGLDIGTVMYCAGADPDFRPFLAGPVDTALAMVQRNCLVPLQVCHHFAAPMQARGSGAVVLVSSAAGLYGSANMVAYGASKAFDTVMAEALWAELHGDGVDVLALVLGATDTPALRRLLAARGSLRAPDDAALPPVPIPGAMTPEEVVAEAIANLSNGPTWFAGSRLRESARQLGALTRSDAVRAMLRHSSGGVMAGGSRREAAR